MRAVLLVGHGSLRPGSGAAMIRLAARVRERGIAPLVAAGFLNYSRPRAAAVIARIAASGAELLVIQPYFLVPGKFVSEDMARLAAASGAAHPQLPIALAQPFGDHPALAELVSKRAQAARPTQDATGLLIIAHGSPDPSANRPIEALARRIQAQGDYAAVVVCYLGLNEPAIGAAIDALVRDGLRRLVAVPYLLQFGGHAAEDIPAAIDAARARHPQAAIALSEHLGYDPLIGDVIAARVAEAVGALAR
jgi:sirohydrochlorin ferrochelatase